MRIVDPKEILQKEDNSKLWYSFGISAAIVQGEHDLAFEFLKRNTDRKGIKGIIQYNCIFSFLWYSISNLVPAVLISKPDLRTCFFSLRAVSGS